MNRSVLLPPCLLTVGIAFMILGACAPLYMPGATHTPTFDSAGQIELAASLGTGGHALQIAHAPFDHIALAGTFSYDPGDLSDSVQEHGHRYGELMAGYYTSFGRSFRLSLLAGYGIGSATVVNMERIQGTYGRIAAQAYIASVNQSRMRHYFEYGFATRLAQLHFSGLERNDTAVADRHARYLEFVGVIKRGMPDLLFEGQVGVYLNVSGDTDDIALTSWFSLAVGMRLRL